ncbi:hypothetical protein MTIM_53950 [Mycobacterium timonense]|uniref:Uncharacterized protein n=1 Tax=Mycobacterium timonense TaxID=701043 RepID=A0A7I9ZFR2_9MYCO|nr:hypothetical protein MTIM_53950 [Mycobacterium timonense]
MTHQNLTCAVFVTEGHAGPIRTGRGLPKATLESGDDQLRAKFCFDGIETEILHLKRRRIVVGTVDGGPGAGRRRGPPGQPGVAVVLAFSCDAGGPVVGAGADAPGIMAVRSAQ